MNKPSKIKILISGHPLAAVATFIAILILSFIVITIAIALYKSATGVVCTGLFGVKESCADVFQIGVTLISILWIHPIGKIAVLAMFALYVLDFLWTCVVKPIFKRF
jgi:hypothetical protein